MPRTLRHSLVVVQSGQLPVDQEAYLVRENTHEHCGGSCCCFLRMQVVGNGECHRWNLGGYPQHNMDSYINGIYFRLAYLMAERNVRVSETLKRLGASSFVIFAMHSLINGRISSVLLFMVGKQNVGDLLTITFYFATIILTVATCYCFHLIVKRNNVTALLFEGGRK